MSDYMAERMPIFFGAVLTLSFLLLMVVFRSLLVPLKAVIMNLLSIAAAYGVTVALFQWGWGSDITDVQPGPIEPWVPMMLFAVVFGLSMDYEVFLLSRIREEWRRTGDSRTSVADGLAATAKVITAAAAIMVVVFGSFMLEFERTMKMMGTGLAVAILFDATIVRMVLVPATMELLGDRNWWLPRWLDRILPNLDVEGTPDRFDWPPEGPEVKVPTRPSPQLTLCQVRPRRAPERPYGTVDIARLMPDTKEPPPKRGLLHSLSKNGQPPTRTRGSRCTRCRGAPRHQAQAGTRPGSAPALSVAGSCLAAL